MRIPAARYNVIFAAVQRGGVPCKMLPDRLPVYDRPELAPKVRYQEPVATPRNHEMLPRKAKRLLILNHEIGAPHRLRFVHRREPTNHEGQSACKDRRSTDPSAQKIGLSGKRNRGIVCNDRVRDHSVGPIREAIMSER